MAIRSFLNILTESFRPRLHMHGCVQKDSVTDVNERWRALLERGHRACTGTPASSVRVVRAARRKPES